MQEHGNTNTGAVGDRNKARNSQWEPNMDLMILWQAGTSGPPTDWPISVSNSFT